MSDLPPLPEPYFPSFRSSHIRRPFSLFSDDDMRAYARAAILADRERRAAPPAEAQESPLDRLVREQQAMGLYDDAMPPADPEVEALKCEIERLRGALKQAREHLAVFPESMGFGLDILPVIDRALGGTKEGEK
jgi:hypothetical protein